MHISIVILLTNFAQRVSFRRRRRALGGPGASASLIGVRRTSLECSFASSPTRGLLSVALCPPMTLFYLSALVMIVTGSPRSSRHRTSWTRSIRRAVLLALDVLVAALIHVLKSLAISLGYRLRLTAWSSP